jgi:predicted metal-dependent HD superfamily phosphohydrolase
MDEQAALLGRLARGFTAAWREVGADGDGTAAVTDLGARYSESHRHYHTLQHVSSVLEALDAHVGELERPQAGVLVVWYHDAVYDPAASDNEARSADLAATHLLAAHAPVDAVARVRAMILDTRHTEPATSPDGALVADADLAIFSAPAIAFDAYDTAIRQEYAFVPEPAYRAARTRVLQAFLDRPFIYQTAAFRKRNEAAARENLGRAMVRLSS